MILASDRFRFLISVAGALMAAALVGAPQPGQADAVSEISLPHSGQLYNMWTSHPAYRLLLTNGDEKLMLRIIIRRITLPMTLQAQVALTGMQPASAYLSTDRKARWWKIERGEGASLIRDSCGGSFDFARVDTG